MKSIFLAVLFPITLAAEPVAEFRGFEDPQGWEIWSPRASLAPKAAVDPTGGVNGSGALKLENERAEQFGTWKRRVSGIEGGKSHRVTARVRTEGVPNPQRSIIARIEWIDGDGRSIRPPEFAPVIGKQGAWSQLGLVSPAPENARAVELQLGLGWSPGGSAWWDDISVSRDPAPTGRIVRAATVHARPQGTSSSAESVEQFCALVEESAAQKPDIICLPEGITVIGTGKSYFEVSEPVPGPTTRRLGKLAEKVNAYIVAGIYERSGEVLYNTSVLIGRDGRLVGKYRKTHLPREEWEAGITAGDEYPVFDTDFGKVGMMICWDVQFPEPARVLAARGAEIILLPIWGGNQTLAKARAIENHIFLISSSYDMRTFIIGPDGEVLAEADKATPVAIADLHLDRPNYQPGLGDMRHRTWMERRADLPADPH